MDKIKEKIKKLLRLSLSNNINEAKLASQKVIELMEKHSLTDNDLKNASIEIQEIEVEYARIPKWYRNLYSDISNINGCYMVWIDGSKINNKKAKIILTGLKKDLQNIEYYIESLKLEIIKKVNKFKKDISSDRETVKSYREGLVRGLYNILYKSSQDFNDKIKDNSLISVDNRFQNAKEFYLDQFSVKVVKLTNITHNKYYNIGFHDASCISVNRPLNDSDKTKLSSFIN